MQKRIFIVGPARSGTTLMKEILTKHTKVGIIGETHLFDQFDYGRREIFDLKKLLLFKNNISNLNDYIDFLQTNISDWKEHDKSQLISILENNFDEDSPNKILESLFDYVFPKKVLKVKKLQFTHYIIRLSEIIILMLSLYK